jgi:peptidoglycan/xylan/chitin deacetylase (PgdA/CDA1 family)
MLRRTMDSPIPSRPRCLPFQERKTPLRGLLDFATARYPAFLFGGPFPFRGVPVFHFHEASPAALEPYFRHIAENAYPTIASAELEAWVLRGVRPPPRAVALTFDDAWSSLYTAVLPLLAKYDLRAIAYVSPARVPDGPGSPAGDPPSPSADRTGPMFCTWPELRELEASGRVDLQAHSLRHAQIPADPAVTGFLQPGARFHPHDIPWTDTPDGPRFLTRADLGAPLHPTRSRLSPALAWRAPEAFAACTAAVRDGGGPAFFDRPDWRDILRRTLAAAPAGRWETPEERLAALREDLGRSREILSSRLGKPVTHMCFPWAVSSPDAVAAARAAGFRTACSDRLFGRHLATAGQPPYHIMRLKHAWLPCLPGRGRRPVWRRLPSASSGLDLRPPLLPPP